MALPRLALASALALAALAAPAPAAPAPAPTWDPARTRAFVVGFTTFQGDKAPTWSQADRLDGPFAELLIARGVPAKNVVVLQDQAATTKAIKAQFEALLADSRPDELLMVYFGSHGNRDPQRCLVYSAFDGPLPAAWLLDAIEARFKGKRALHFADSCYSGALADEAARRPRIAHAVLASTAKAQVAWSEWRFVECLLRGFRGDARVDLGGDGKVDLAELAAYTRRHLAFVAEGRPTFWAAPAFGPLTIADVASPGKDARIGAYVDAEWNGTWYRAEVRDVDGDRLHVHYNGYPASDDEWVPVKRTRPPRSKKFAVGANVELEGDDGVWYPGRVLAAEAFLHLGRYDGYGPEYDEWFGDSRIRRAKP